MKKSQPAAEGQHKQNSTKSGKTRAQKDAHNKSCRLSREKKKRRHKDLEEVENRYNEMIPEFEKMQTEKQEIKLELERCKSIIRKMENELQRYRTNLAAQIKNEEQVRQNPIEWKGQNFYFEELEKWLLSDEDEFPGLRATGTGNLPGFGQDYSNTASAANHAGSSSSAAGSLDASYGWSELGVTNQHDNAFNIDLAAGFPTHSAAVPSLGANPERPIVHDTTKNHENADNLSTLGTDATGS